MSAKTVPTNEELLAQFDTIDGDDAQPPTSSTSSSTSKPPPKSSEPTNSSKSDEDDPLAELTALAAHRSSSRPATPRRKDVVNTPSSSTGSGRTSEDKGRTVTTSHPAPAQSRKSGESGFQQRFTPTVEDADDELKARREKAEGGGWWGGIFGAASAAMKTGEAFVKDLQKNEEAQKWAERVQENALSLRGLGTHIQSDPVCPPLDHTYPSPSIISLNARFQMS